MSIIFKEKKQIFMNVADISKEANSGDFAVKTSFTNNTLSFVPSTQNFVNSAFSVKCSPSSQPMYFAEASAAKQNLTF